MTDAQPQPGAARVTTFRRGDLTFDVLDRGPLDGEVVILLHGFPQDATCWDAVAPRLHEAGLRTLAPNQRGYSPNASPREVSAYRLGELVKDVLAPADAAGLERFHLVGHDWGGSVAWVTALSAPQRLRSLTVLSTAHPSAMEAALQRRDQALASWYMLVFQLPLLPEVWLSRGMVGFLTWAGMPKDLARKYAARFNTRRRLHGPLAWYRALNLVPRMLGQVKDDPTPGRTTVVTVPTTYVWGSRDVSFARESSEGTEAWVEADYRFIELDAGHWLPECNVEDVVDAVLDRVERAGQPQG